MTHLTNSTLVAPPSPKGVQQPRISHVPRSYSSIDGDDAMRVVEMAGIDLDPWEEAVLRASLGLRRDRKWSAKEVGVVCPRQNGKDEIIAARELVGLFMLGERLIVHTAHLFPTSREHFRRLVDAIESTPSFRRKLKPRSGIRASHGEEGIELKDGRRILFATRGGKKGSGRGFTSDLLIFNEAMDLKEETVGDVFPTLSARPNPQVWYAGSAVDQWVHDHGIVFARLRERGIAKAKGLAFFEWSHDADNPEDVDEDTAANPEVWAQANPALGIRIEPEHVAHEQETMPTRTFAVERLGVGDWPSTDPDDDSIIGRETWLGLVDMASTAEDPITFVFDVTPDRRAAAICAAGEREDGKIHTEVIEHGAGTGWVGQRLKELQERHRPRKILCDERGPAASLIPELEELGVDVETINAAEHARACGTFFDLCEQDGLRHLNTAELNSAVRGAATRPLTDAWAWSRKTSAVDISPLVACTIAVWSVHSEISTEPLIAFV